MNRFKTLENGNIHDAQLGVEWFSKSLKAKNHAAAMSQCEALGDGWRAPTIKELMTLIDHERSEPAIDTDLFPGTKSDRYWSSSRVVGDDDYAWYVYFDYGSVSGGHRRGYEGFVRPVRVVQE